MRQEITPDMTSTTTGRKNVVVLFTDQQRWDTVGAHGNPLGITPNFDKMAAEGVLVTHSFTNQPVCAPSRASLQTGRFPAAVGVHRNAIPLPEDATTIAKLFGAAGYETAYFGKWHLADDDVAGPVRPEQRGGYERWLAANLLEFTSDAYQTTLYDEEGQPHELEGYRADAVTDAAIDFVREDHERPFFCFVSLLEPHHQNSRDDYPAPDGYAEKYEGTWVPDDLTALGGGNWAEHLGGYLGMVARVDENLGRLRAAIDEAGLADDTVVLFTSDHGCHFKTRNDEYKRSVHDASIRVPTALVGPGLDTGAPVQRQVGHVDLTATLLDAAGLGVPAELHGHSIMPTVRGDDDGRADELLVQVSETEVGRAIRTPQWKYGVVAPGVDAWEEPGATEYEDAYLYDLVGDPHELTNLVGRAEHSATVADLRARLTDLMVHAGEVPPTIHP